MFSPRNILYIKQYQELAGQKPKARYLIVLHNDNQNTIFLSTTTTQIKFPLHYATASGCICDLPNQVHSYNILSGEVVGEKNNFSFPEDSFINVAFDVFEKNEKKIKSKYEDNGLVELKDIMLEERYGDLLYCIYKNKNLRRGIKRRLESLLDSIYNKA